MCVCVLFAERHGAALAGLGEGDLVRWGAMGACGLRAVAVVAVTLAVTIGMIPCPVPPLLVVLSQRRQELLRMALGPAQRGAQVGHLGAQGGNDHVRVLIVAMAAVVVAVTMACRVGSRVAV